MVLARAHPGKPALRRESFDPVARLYRWAEYLLLGPLLTRCREHFLPTLGGCRSALVLGDGDGRFLQALLRLYPALRATAVDDSQAMLTLVRRRTAFAANRVRLLQARLPQLPRLAKTPAPDLIVTHFFLDCLDQAAAEQLACRVASLCAPGALWLLSDFAIPAEGAWHWIARIYVRSLYAAFRVLTGLRTQTLPDIDTALRQAGFTRISRHLRVRGLLTSELWQLLPVASRATSPRPLPSTQG